MGSSTRKTQDKIKKILQNDGKPLEFEEGLSKAMNETLRLKKSKNYFGNKDFLNLVSGGINGLASLGSGNFKKEYNTEFEFNFEDDYVLDNLTIDEIIEIILNKIEQSEEIEKASIRTAFKLAMAELLLNKELSPEKFIRKFISYMLYYLIMENINEAILEVYEDIHASDYKNRVKSAADNAVDFYLADAINQFTKGEIDFSGLVKQIIDISSIVSGGLNEN